jgi:hypothetical protein
LARSRQNLDVVGRTPGAEALDHVLFRSPDGTTLALPSRELGVTGVRLRAQEKPGDVAAILNPSRACCYHEVHRKSPAMRRSGDGGLSSITSARVRARS